MATPLPTTQPLRRLGTFSIALLSLYWVALGYLWLPLGSQVLPIVIVNLVGNALKGAAVATLEGVGTFLATLWQPVMGAISEPLTVHICLIDRRFEQRTS